MEDDHHAQYLVGMSLKNKALMLKEQQLALADSGEQDVEAQALLNKSVSAKLENAAYWFAKAGPFDADALFEHGVALLHGYLGEADEVAGQAAIKQAAEQGVVNAMALLGYFYLVGSHQIAQDLKLAEHYLYAAAQQEQAEAMSNLGVLYYQQGQLEQAYDCISRAAKSGFPNAQYHLALMLANGDGCQIDLGGSEHWLAEAAEQGQLDAMLARAQHMLNDDNAFGEQLSQAEVYLRDVIRYGRSVPAMIELSVALADGVLGRIDVVGAAALLKMAADYGNEQELQVIERYGSRWRCRLKVLLQ